MAVMRSEQREGLMHSTVNNEGNLVGQSYLRAANKRNGNNPAVVAEKQTRLDRGALPTV